MALEIRAVVEAKTLERAHSGSGLGLVLPAGVYVPTEYRDLGLSDIAASQVEIKAWPVMHISGKIINPRPKAIAIPPLWFTAVDRYGAPLKSQQAVLDRWRRVEGLPKIPARGSLAFTYDLSPLPDKSARAVVTFAPRDRPSIVQPARRQLNGSRPSRHCGPNLMTNGQFHPWRTNENGVDRSLMVYFSVPLGAAGTETGGAGVSAATKAGVGQGQ